MNKLIFLPNFFYLIAIIAVILIPVIVIITDISSSVIFGFPFFIVFAILFFLYWIGKLDRNIASEISVIGLLIALMITLTLYFIGEGGLGIAQLILVLSAIIVLGSFLCLYLPKLLSCHPYLLC